MDAEAARLRVEENEVRAVVRDYPAQTDADGGKQFIQAQMGDHRIVDLEEKAHAIALAG